MFAPTTIQVRYGDNGALAAGAGSVGSGDNYGRQKAMDMQFIDSEMSRRQQANEFAAQQDSQRLQLAQELAMRRVNGTPTSVASTRQSSPFATAIQNQKHLAYASGTAGVSLPPEQDALLKSLANDPNVNADDFQQIVHNVSKNQSGLSAKDADKKAKAEYVKTLPAAVQGKVAALAESDDIDLPKLRIAASDILDRETVKPGAVLSYGVSNIDSKMKQTRDAMQRVATETAKSTGFNVEQAPADMNPTYQNPADTMEDSDSDPVGLGRAVNYWTGPTTQKDESGQPVFHSGGNKEAMKQMKLYYGLQAQLQQLQQQREQMIATATAGQQAGQQQQLAAGQQQQQVNTPVAKGSKQITSAIAAHFLTQANGDKTKARSLALAEGYSF